MRSAALLLAASVSLPAAAQDMLTAGLLFGFSKHDGDSGQSTQIGGEIAYQRILGMAGPLGPFGMGGYGQLEGVDGFRHGRYGLGLRAQFGILGLDAGLALEESDGTRRTTTYFQLAPTLSGGGATISFRIAWPMAAEGRYPRELGLVFSIRFPLLQGERRRRGDY